MYEGFSGQARRAVELAHEQAQHWNHRYLGTEHLLLGVLREEAGGAGRVLGACGVDPEGVAREAKRHLQLESAGEGPGQLDWDKLPLTPSAKRVFRAAREASAELHHPCVGPEHLLAGMVRESECVAAEILQSLGLEPGALQRVLAELPAPDNRDWMLRPEPPAGAPAPGDPSARQLEALVAEEVLPPLDPLPKRNRRRKAPSHHVQTSPGRPLRGRRPGEVCT
jgi:ATP-dependent Clp protease ATP-binding subunit ClpA